MKRALRSGIKRLARRLGRDVLTFRAYNGKEIDVLPFVVGDLISRGLGGPIVQIGAHDGVQNDPVRPLILRHNLPALLVEPLPGIFERLQENYRSHPQVICAQCAIAETPGQMAFYRVRPGQTHLPGYIQAVASLDRKQTVETVTAAGGSAADVEEIQVKAVGIGELVRSHQLPAPMLLQIDAEGMDFKIIQMALKDDISAPLIRWELVNLSPDDQEACRAMLIERGYTFVTGLMDVLAVHKSVLPAAV